MNNNTDKVLALVLTCIPLNDQSQLVHFYSREYGRITCRVALNSRGRRAQQMRTLMTPMTMLELILAGKPTDNIRTLSEASIVQSPYLMTLTHPGKASQCLYMAELLAHTVREEESNPQLWDFITSSLEILEQCELAWNNLHLIFTVGLTSLLGFCVNTEAYTPGCCFDLIEGTFTTSLITHPYYFDAESSRWFCRLLLTRYSTMSSLELTRPQRAALLDMLLAFLAQHIPEMGTLHSIAVLREL